MDIKTVPVYSGKGNIIGAISLNPETKEIIEKGQLFTLSGEIKTDITGSELSAVYLIPIPTVEKDG